MKLTKLQRHTLYCILQQEYNEYPYRAFCSVISDLVGIDLDEDNRFSNFKLMMPELWAKRASWADELSGYLFEDTSDRIDALNQCIAETA